MHKNPVLFGVVALAIAILSCNTPQGQELSDLQTKVAGMLTATVVAPDAAALTKAAADAAGAPPVAPSVAPPGAPPPTACQPMVTANQNANIRNGPGTVYAPPIGNLLTGQTALVDGRNAEGTWWYIVFAPGPAGHAWIAGSTVNATCIPTSVAVVAAPPTPLPASGTCKDNYVWRLIRGSDKVCVSPASKAQADADNSAANARLCTATYGPDTCAQGYVWRDAFSGDHVCVSGATRDQAASDNAAAASRVDPINHTYGPDTCLAGYVWREANPSDHVCVTGAVRSAAAADNAAAASRMCTATYGPDTCAQGYVWRGAFGSDHVCVTGAVRDQTAADNANAPSHTWP